MTLIVYLIIAVAIAALLIWAVDYLPIPSVPANILKALIIVLAVVAVVQRGGWL